MGGSKDAAPDEATHGHGADAENARRFVEGDRLVRCVVGASQCGEIVVAAVRPYAVGVPGEPRGGADANPVEVKAMSSLPTLDGVIAEEDYLPLVGYVRSLVSASTKGN